MKNLIDWKKILNWQIVPDFGAIHKLDEHCFEKYYYLPEIITEVINDIVFSIKEEYGFTNKILIGDPGSGKTTFLYYLKYILAKQKKAFKNYHFEIVHLQRIVNINKQEEVIELRTLRILRNYFNANKLDSEYDTIRKGNEIKKEVINNLEDFIVSHKEKFNKKMIIIIDDIDETNEEIAEKCLRYFYSLLECEQISKWLIARSATLDNYNTGFLDFIETKFPQTMLFPRVDLYGIINKRVKAENPDGINPFGSELCTLMISVYDYDLRKSTPNIIAFLEQLPPTKNAKNNPNFAGHYLLMNFTRVMTSKGRFPNLYYNSILGTVPLERDIFIILAKENRIYSGFIPTLISHYKTAYRKLFKGRYAEESYLIDFNMDHVEDCIGYLTNHRLIKLHSRIKDFYTLTPRGEAFLKFTIENIYTDFCKKQCQEAGKDKHNVFWELAQQYPDYMQKKSTLLET